MPESIGFTSILKPMLFIFKYKLKKNTFYTFLVFATLSFILLQSCENDMIEVSKLTSKDSIPDVEITDLKMIETRNGNVRMELEGKKMVSFQSNEAYTLFPEGVHIVFYDSLKNIESEISANYGISWETKNLMQAKGNVVIKNVKKSQVLNTEILFWDKTKQKIYTDEFVKITDPERIIMGKGLESNEIFNNWIIRNVTGTIYVNEND